MMRPTIKRHVLPWAALVLLVGVELALVALHAGWVAPVLGVVMAACIALGPMRLLEAPAQAHVFALAGVFWLGIVLLGLGSLDPLTRHDQPAFVHAEP